VCPGWIGHILPETANKWGGPRQRAGPLSFLMYVDGVDKLFGSSVSCKLYADDVKLYSVIQTEQDASELQSILDAL